MQVTCVNRSFLLERAPLDSHDGVGVASPGQLERLLHPSAGLRVVLQDGVPVSVAAHEAETVQVGERAHVGDALGKRGAYN